MKLYHCTTPHKLAKYRATGCILSPVRGWQFIESARDWCKKTGRTVILEIEASTVYPLPDHKPTGHAWWTPDLIHSWVEVA